MASNESSHTNKMLGEFYTPERVAKTLHRMVKSVLGEDVYKKYVVWDPAWGTGNLTKGEIFDQLYVSTLRDLDVRRGEKHIDENTELFQYDFLNDDISVLESLQSRLTEELKMPEGLEDAIENDEPILFLMNPPYGRSGGGMSRIKSKELSKTSVAVNGMRDLMQNDRIGEASANMYTQFLYRVIKMKRVYKLSNVCIALICPPQYMSTATLKSFRDEMFSEFKLEKAKLICANEFGGLSKDWGIQLSVWTSGKTDDKYKFLHEVIEYDDKENEVYKCDKYIYNTDDTIPENNYIRSLIKPFEREYMAVFGSGCSPQLKSYKGNKSALAHLGCGSNNVAHNNQSVVVVSGAYSDGGGIPITEDNIDEIARYFTARKVVAGKHATWVNDKDEYRVPDVNSTDEDVRKACDRLLYDGYVYMTFSNSCHSASMKNVPFIEYEQESRCRVMNNLFWLSKEHVKSVYYNAGLEVEDTDFETDKNRFGYYKIQKYLEDGKLSDKAIQLMNKANELFERTVRYRADFDDMEKEFDYQTRNWDCGWYQIKQMVKEYLPDEWVAFNKLHSELGDELRDSVYKSGMLLR